MMQSLSEYVALACRTESFCPESMSNRLLADEGQAVRLLHAALGMASEAGELAAAVGPLYTADGFLDLTNTVEELGDLAWYAAIAADALGERFETLFIPYAADPAVPPTPVRDEFRSAFLGMTAAIGGFADGVKRAIYYGQDLGQQDLTEALAGMLWHLSHLASLVGCSMLVICKVNIAKLQERYPAKFTADKAANRDLAAERAALEGNH